MRLGTAGIWIGGFALYLMFAGQLGAHEIGTGALVAGLTGLWARRVQAHGPRRFIVARAHAAPWSRAVAGLPRATLATGAALIRALGAGDHPGLAQSWTFQPGARDDPAERARRASAVMLASLAPDGFVLRAEPGEGRVLIHRLGKEAPQPDPRWLG